MSNKYRPTIESEPMRIDSIPNVYTLDLVGSTTHRPALHFEALSPEIYRTQYNVVEESLRGYLGKLPDLSGNTRITLNQEGILMLYQDSDVGLTFDGRYLVFDVGQIGSLTIPVRKLHTKIQAYKNARRSLRDLRLTREKQKHASLLESLESLTEPTFGELSENL